MQQTPIQVGEYSFTILIEPNDFKVALNKNGKR